MPDIVRDFKKFSELAGGMKIRPWTWYHYRAVNTAGTSLLHFFDATSTTKDVDWNAPPTPTSSFTNIREEGRFSDLFWVQEIAVDYLPGSGGILTGVNPIADFCKVMYGGKITLKINLADVYEESPLIAVGSRFAVDFNAGGLSYGAGSFNKKTPYSFERKGNPMGCPKGIPLACEIRWTTPPTPAAICYVGVAIMGLIALAQ